MPEIFIKRVYEAPSQDDGMRVLVDRLWPRGLRKEKAAVDLWAKDIAPSHELRKRYHGGGLAWEGFRSAYFSELDAAADAVTTLEGEVAGRRLTFLTAAKDVDKNHAVVLREFLLGR